MGIGAYRAAKAQAAVGVACARDAGFVGCTQAPSTVVLPKGFRTDMAAGGAVFPLGSGIGKELPGIVVGCADLVRQGCIDGIQRTELPNGKRSGGNRRSG